ncbi:MAG: hypothetical protein SFV15_14740 [Polyangiaceae bacterium]|nr:hypothetical protein [Polyangiaceae bacterium]
MTLTWLNDAGGLRYHARALRYSKELWHPFRWALGEWLLGFQPTQKTLLLAGPSGGYCIQPFVFERYERIVCLEPDPFARFIFQRKLRRAPLERQPRVEFIAEDHLIHHPEKFPKLVESLGDTALMFSNVIGQACVLLGVDQDGPELARVRMAVGDAIKGRAWVSFHDRVSGYLRPTFEQPLVCRTRMTDDEVAEHLFEVFDPKPEGPEYALTDHLTHGFFPEALPHTYFSWELLPGAFHVIEGVFDDGTGAAERRFSV